MLIISLIGLIVTTAGVTWQIASNNNDTPQTSSGSNSPNITVKENPGNTNINVNVGSKKEGVPIPIFEGQIQPLSEKDYNGNGRSFNNSEKFNQFMIENDGKIVYLNVWPYYSDETLDSKEFSAFDKPKSFSIDDVPYEFGSGTEYIIQSSDADDFFFDGRQSSRRIVGNFKIVGISGPRQGYMSVVIKPVNIEMAELLKK